MYLTRKTNVQRRTTEIVIRTASDNQEYGFGIISPLTGNVTPIEGHFSSETDHSNQDRFESWSVSMYQSLYHPAETIEEGVEELEESEISRKKSQPNKSLRKQDSSQNQRQRKESWLLILAHLPERIHQQLTERHRFNVNNVSSETREQLKSIYVY